MTLWEQALCPLFGDCPLVGNLLKSCNSNDFKLAKLIIIFVVHASEFGFLHLAEIQLSLVPDLPISAACFLCT